MMKSSTLRLFHEKNSDNYFETKFKSIQIGNMYFSLSIDPPYLVKTF